VPTFYTHYEQPPEAGVPDRPYGQSTHSLAAVCTKVHNVCMSFDWDEKKYRANIKDHGIRFEDAQRIFDGPVLTVIDERYHYDEMREISLGLLDGVVVLMVVHTDRHDITRLISARKATPRERRRYEKAIRESFDS